MEIEYHPAAESEVANALEWYTRIDGNLAVRERKPGTCTLVIDLKRAKCALSAGSPPSDAL